MQYTYVCCIATTIIGRNTISKPIFAFHLLLCLKIFSTWEMQAPFLKIESRFTSDCNAYPLQVHIAHAHINTSKITYLYLYMMFKIVSGYNIIANIFTTTFTKLWKNPYIIANYRLVSTLTHVPIFLIVRILTFYIKSHKLFGIL